MMMMMMISIPAILLPEAEEAEYIPEYILIPEYPKRTRPCYTCLRAC